MARLPIDEDLTLSAPPALGPGDHLLRLQEVLSRVRHKKSWLYAMIDAGGFPAGYRIGRRRFWLESEVEDAIRQLLLPAAPSVPRHDGARSELQPTANEKVAPPALRRRRKS
jgi:predicted DNA-binding transcriptional regulator AlpA